jgi:hypothetical protein
MSNAPRVDLRSRLRAISTRAWVHAVVVLVCTGAAIGHQATLWHWFIEDAAISFAYAKNLAEGHGLVSFPGGERVEGYSNPVWTFSLAGLHWLGFDLFEVVKWIQVLQAAITVPVSYLIGREAFRDRPNNDAVLLVPALLAANAQFAIWGSAGLENGSLHLFMALAIWRLLVEARAGGVPWSAALWLLVALSRPESITYAAVGGFLSMVFALQAGRGLRSTLGWLLIFWPPFLVYHAIRYDYFAWPFPNTYYAKVDHRDGVEPGWGKRPWMWSQRWAHELGHGYLMPLYLFGVLGHGRVWRVVALATTLALVGGSIQMVGDQRWLLPVVLGVVYLFFGVALAGNGDDERAPRGLIAGGLIGGLALFAASEFARAQFGFSPNKLPSPESLKLLPPVLLVVGGLVMPLLSVGSPGWRARVTCWAMAIAATFFAVWAEYDWMKGYRWYATAAIPGSVLLALGVDSMLNTLASWLRLHGSRFALGMGYGWALIVLVGFATIHGFHTKGVVEKPDAKPQGVKQRVTFVESVRDTLFFDDARWIDLDVDQGAHLYWSDFEMLDIAGLIDVPMGHHKFERAFIREYVFQEKKPHFAHVHGTWATTSRIPSHTEWKRDYVEIPGFPAGSSQLHIGNYVRKDLLLVDRSPFPADQRRTTDRGLVFEGFSVPVEPAKARAMYLEVGVRTLRKQSAGDFKLWVALKGSGGFASFELPMGYGWWDPSEWTPDKVFHGKFGVPLPATLLAGTYDVAFVLTDEQGAVIPMSPGDERPPLMALGEARFDRAVTIVTAEERADRAAADREAAVEAAEEGRCAEADALWWRSRRSRPLDSEWLDEHAQRMREVRADCLVRAATQTDDRQEQVELIERARYLDPKHEGMWALARAVADPFEAEGMAAYEAGRAACAEVAPAAQGPLARFRATTEDYRALQACLKEQGAAWRTAYDALSMALRADPMRSWARRTAEEARALRLGIDEVSLALQKAEVESRRVDVERRRQEFEAKKKDGTIPAPDEAEGGDEEGEEAGGGADAP